MAGLTLTYVRLQVSTKDFIFDFEVLWKVPKHLLKLKVWPTLIFHIWNQKMPLFLTLRDFDQNLEENDLNNNDSMKECMRRDGKARAVIGLSFSDEHLEHLRNICSAMEMCNTILNVFERDTLLNKLASRRKLYTVSMGGEDKVLPYIYRVKPLAGT